MKKRSLALILAVIGLGAASVYFLNGSRSGPRGSADDRSSIPESGSPAAENPDVSTGRTEQIAAANSTAPEDEKKLATLNTILASRNDNDPRLDRDFNELSEAQKALFKARYNELAPEKRNERGTIVFLLGRNLSTDADFNFLCEVLREPPCLSLKNCSGDPASGGKEDFDRESGEEVTLAYPQLVAIKSLENYLSKHRSSRLSPDALKALDCAKDSKVPGLGQNAAQVSQTFSDRR
ncbi:MAG TPA: hypothetical protein VJB59_06095 [Bdellovibrionota bacterium]|nr:hypothetical protein [Bdellovibrionota bacterium]